MSGAVQVTQVDDALIAELRRALTGAGHHACCCHYDVLDLDVMHADRRCVLDDQRPKDCDVAEYKRFEKREDCYLWRSVPLVAPRQLSIGEAMTLLDALEDARAAKKDDRLAVLYGYEAGLGDEKAAEHRGYLRAVEDAKVIAYALTDQRDEPFPGSETDRLHYWRDKAIEAADRIRKLKPGGEER